MSAQSPNDSEARGLLAWFAGNPVAANLLMVLLLVGGFAAALGTTVESFPKIDPRTITVRVPYPGATPAEVEESINRRVEEAISGIEGIKRVRSIASEGSGTVTAELEDRARDRDVLDDIKSAVEQLQNFPPEDAEDVEITDTDTVERVITLALYGDAPERTLKELANQVRDGLAALPGVSLTSVTGARAYEVGVEVSERSLREHGLSFDELARAVRGYSVNLPGGSIRARDGEVLLRTSAQAYDREDFGALMLRSEPDGTRLLLRDVATIVDGFRDEDVIARFNGKPAVFVNVSRVGDQRLLDIENSVRDYAARISLPAGVEAATWSNQAELLRSRMDLMIRNGLLGLVLVFGVLVLFLELKLAFWTTMGIPIAFLGAFLVMPLFGASINMVSLFGLIIVLGIVVDDAIVVGENVFALREAGLSPIEAAVQGVRQMAAPVTIGVLTTVAAFLPLAFTAGFLGQVLWQVPVVVVSVLLMSLVEALFILPAHLSHGRLRRPRGPLPVIQRRFRAGLDWLVERTYLPVVGLGLRWRYATVAVAVAGLMLAVSGVAGGHVRFVFFPRVDSDNLSARLEMPQGTPVAVTHEAVERLLTAAEGVREDLDASVPIAGHSIYRNVAATIGTRAFERSGPPIGGTGGSAGSHVGEVTIELLSSELRDTSSSEVERRWRERIGAIPGVASMTFTSSMLSAGDDISVELAHADFDRLLIAADMLRAKLGEYEGVSEIDDSFDPGKRELQLALTDAGVASGLSLATLARQVRQGFYGEEAQRVQRGRDDIKVMVRYPEAERRDLASIYAMRVRLPDGQEVPFRTVARVTDARGYSTIDRADRRRVVTVTAKVDEELASAGRINEELRSEVLPGLVRDIPGLAFGFEGAEQERMESVQSLAKLLAIAILVIFAMLAAQLRSYAQPVIIMSVIPFGAIGAILGHYLTGYTLSFFSTFGLVAMAGVVVNDSLVFMDGYNRYRGEGVAPREALLLAGQRRFRPILFTTLTTFAGLAPMMLEKSVQAQFLIPMAISLAYGVLFATSVTLVLVPALTLILEDARGLLAKLGGTVDPEPSSSISPASG